MEFIKTNISAILFDLDGVLFVGDEIIDGAIETIEYLKSKNIPLRFLTNTTTKSMDSLHEKIIKLNLPIEKSELFAPPKIAARYLKKFDNPKLLLILEEDTKLEFSDYETDETNPNFIVLGHYGNRWNYDLMSRLFKMIMNGSKMLALHKGRYWLTEEGLTLDIGAFVVGLEHASSQKAIVVGKPSKTFFKIALDDMNIAPENAVMIGDDIINDIEGAQKAGIKGILVKTGKYQQEAIDISSVTPDMIIDSVKELRKIF